MHNLSNSDENGSYVTPEYEGKTSKNIIVVDRVYEYALLKGIPVQSINISEILFKEIVFFHDFTIRALNEIDINSYMPVLLLTGLTLPQNKHYLCIDGKHRLNKLSSCNVEVCNALIVNIEEIQRYIF